jgi:hypothetical protein
MMAILTGVRWNLSVVLICISFWLEMVSISSYVFWPFEFVLLRKFCLVQLPIDSMILEELSFLSSMYILVISPLSDVQLANIFSHSVGGLLLCRSFLVL